MVDSTKRYFPKLMRMGRNHTTYAILIPKGLIKKYNLEDEERLLLEEDEVNKVLVIKKIPLRPTTSWTQ